ncbi:MAG: hypothetical protein DMF06_03270 [Verrucomicrobia bacterium]|nr:MAG: hypothetical protein DMF06_03270 [Verrucomicrobiota bacterium]
MRVFIVAPKSNLGHVPDEVQDILNSGLQIVGSMLGNVTYTEFLREIRRTKADVLWLAMHGGAEGWKFNSGLVDGPALAALIRGRFSYVYLNTCQSLIQAQVLQNEGQVDVVCTVRDLDDLSAYSTGSLMAAALAESDDFRQAYERSKPGNNTNYIYLAGSQNRFLDPKAPA